MSTVEVDLRPFGLKDKLRRLMHIFSNQEIRQMAQ
jgi:hypothetical protein